MSPHDDGDKAEKHAHHCQPQNRLEDEVHLHKLVKGRVGVVASLALHQHVDPGSQQRRHDQCLKALMLLGDVVVQLALDHWNQQHGEKPPLQRLIALLVPVLGPHRPTSDIDHYTRNNDPEKDKPQASHQNGGVKYCITCEI